MPLSATQCRSVPLSAAQCRDFIWENKYFSAVAAGGGVTVGMRGGSGSVLQNPFHILTDGNARAPAVPQVPEPAEVPTESELTRLRNQWFNGALILPDPLSETYGLRIVQ